MFEWGIESLTFSGGQTIPVEKSSLLVIVGPNNSGKSRALSEIDNALGGSGDSDRLVVKSSATFHSGDLNDLRIWLDSRFSSRIQGGDKFYRTRRMNVGDSILGTVLREIQGGPNRGRWREFLFERLNTETRLGLVNPVELINPHDGGGGHYIHILQSNDALMRDISDEFRKAFGEGLVIDWLNLGGNKVCLRVGKEPERTVENDRLSAAYTEALKKLPLLHAEGDGVRSYAGTLLAAKCGKQAVLVVDEPEAFLYPKQAERLGAILAESAETLNRQIIVATHSSAFIRGAVNKSRKVSVCRLTRNRSLNINHASVLDSSALKSLWSSPILRSTLAIDGVFSQGVVACEADGDSRFYEAALLHLEAQGIISSPAELHFVHGSGKSSIAKLVRAYRRLNISVAAIADLDLLRNKSEFEVVVTALGGDFLAISDLYTKTIKALNDMEPQLSTTAFVAQARVILNQVESQGELIKDDRRRLSEMLDQTAHWSDAKRYGIDKLRSEPRKTAQALLAQCQTFGLFLVSKGSLESWWLNGPVDKNAWLSLAIEQITGNNSELQPALDFVKAICDYIYSQSSTTNTGDA